MTGPFLISAPTSTVAPLAFFSTIGGAWSPTFNMVRAIVPARSSSICRCMIACRSAGTRWYQPARYSASCSFKDILSSFVCFKVM